MSERILVTGAGGFIGSHLVEELLERGHHVFALDHRWHEPRQRRNAGLFGEAECLDVDMVDRPLAPLLRRVDRVVHLAGSPGVQTSWASGFEHHLRNNVLATQRLLEAALDAPVERIVVASSSSVYGNVPQGRASEDRALRPESPYGASKAAMEMLLSAYVHRGLSVMPLRFFTVYGPRQRPDMAIHRMIEATRGGDPFPVRGDGRQERSYTFVADVVAATLAALDSTSSVPVNVGGAEVVSVDQVLQQVAHLVGVPVARTMVAAVPGDPQRTSADTTRAGELLGFERSVGFIDGLRRQIEWQLSLSPAAV